MASTKAKHGRHPKSIWTSAASWFSNTPEDPGRLTEKPPPKEILAKRFGRLRSRRVKTAVKSPESAVYRRGLGIFLTETPPTDTPRHRDTSSVPHFPRTPPFPRPPVRSNGSFSGLPQKANSLQQ
jgi:hypothetical protein